MKNHVKVKFISENLFHSHDLLLNLKIQESQVFLPTFISFYISTLAMLLSSWCSWLHLFSIVQKYYALSNKVASYVADQSDVGMTKIALFCLGWWEIGQMVENQKSKSTETRSKTWWDTLYRSVKKGEGFVPWFRVLAYSWNGVGSHNLIFISFNMPAA